MAGGDIGHPWHRSQRGCLGHQDPHQDLAGAHVRSLAYASLGLWAWDAALPHLGLGAGVSCHLVDMPQDLILLASAPSQDC
jgi:hypothetical protein